MKSPIGVYTQFPDKANELPDEQLKCVKMKMAMDWMAMYCGFI